MKIRQDRSNRRGPELRGMEPTEAECPSKFFQHSRLQDREAADLDRQLKRVLAAMLVQVAPRLFMRTAELIEQEKPLGIATRQLQTKFDFFSQIATRPLPGSKQQISYTRPQIAGCRHTGISWRRFPRPAGFTDTSGSTVIGRIIHNLS